MNITHLALLTLPLAVVISFLLGRRSRDRNLIAVPKESPSKKPTGDSHVAALTGKQFKQACITANPKEEGFYKMVILVRTDLKMTKGKACAQVGHAVVGALFKAPLDVLGPWLRNGQKKITLQCPTIAELRRLEQEAGNIGITTKSIQDAGHTQVDAGTVTVCAIGPAPEGQIDTFCNHLKLF